jgi:signal transduction histidine kinase
LVAVPLAAVLAFAALALVTTAGQSVSTRHLGALVQAAADAAGVADALQGERAAAALVLVAPGASAMNTFLDRAAVVDLAVDGYRQSRSRLSDVPARSADLLGRVDGDLAGLVALRKPVESGSPVAASATAFSYRIVIADLLSFAGSVEAGAPPAVADQIRAGAAVEQAQESLGEEQVAVLNANASGVLTAAAQETITGARTGFTESLVSFSGLAPSWQGWIDQAQAGPDVLTTQRLEDRVARTPIGAPLHVDPVAWSLAMSARMSRLRVVAVKVDAAVLQAVTDQLGQQTRGLIAETSGVTVAVIVAVFLQLLLGRPVIRRLGVLRDGARGVAYDLLPAAVRGLRSQDALGQASPAEFAAREAPPPADTGGDEIGEVVEAFGEVHRTALTLAAEQAMERASLGAMLIALARRGDSLLGRLIRLIADEERGEQDPKRLAWLFRLDHAATIMKRTYRTLLVVGGQGSGQVYDADVSLDDVLKGALSQIEQYQRVELHVVDAGVEVRRDVVDDVVHLVAELLDNATRYSHPDTPVIVKARLLTDRVLIQIVDSGVGIDPPERLVWVNKRLASAPVLDVDAVRSMGLTAVATIADLHHLGVHLQRGMDGGVVAEITLPASVLRIDSEPRSLAGAHRQAIEAPLAAVPTMPVMPAAPPWPPLCPAASPLPAQPPAAPLRGARPPVSLQLSSVSRQRRSSDRTEELPIFGAVQDSWFQGRPAEAVGRWDEQARAGWEAAATAASPRAGGVTANGMPKRVPGAQLVPGAVGEGDPAQLPLRRNAEGTRASMNALVRGVGRSRANRSRPPQTRSSASSWESQ